MAKHAKPAWGNLGVICVRGAVQTDDELVARGIVPGEEGRGDRGCVLSDEQFDRLAVHLKLTGSTMVAEVRARFDFIRRFYLASRLYEAASPTQAERNAALAIVQNRIAEFRAAVDALGPLPEWPLSEPDAIEDLSPFCLLTSLPERLRVLADMVLESAPAQSAEAARLLLLSKRAVALSGVLQQLDFASQADIINRLPWTRDYGMETFAEVARMTQKLGGVVGEALAAGRRRGGPRPFEELVQAVAWLREIYECCGGTFTHTPREKTHYDGRPHSAAGRFVADFFKMCDPELRPQSISSAMAKVISSRPRIE